MSNKQIKTIELDKDEHLFETEVNRSYFNWFDALFSAIKKDLKDGRVRRAEVLADIGQYLSQDIGHYKDIELDDLKKT